MAVFTMNMDINDEINKLKLLLIIRLYSIKFSGQ